MTDFLDVFGLNAAAFLSYANILSDRVLLPYVLRNLVYDLPEVGRRQFLPHVQKVVPSVELGDVERATGYGGVRPQIVDTNERSLDMGEAKIVGDDVIFNITPSPGASTCLENAMRDTRTLLEFFDGDYGFDGDAFRADTIDNFPREGTVDATGIDTADEISATDDWSAASGTAERNERGVATGVRTRGPLPDDDRDHSVHGSSYRCSPVPESVRRSSSTSNVAPPGTVTVSDCPLLSKLVILLPFLPYTLTWSSPSFKAISPHRVRMHW